MSLVEDGKSLRLNNGQLMPLIGLGCFKLTDGECVAAVEEALRSGYRHIDTATFYLNEKSVGQGIGNWVEKSGGKREDVFVVTKLPIFGLYAGGPTEYLKKSLANFGLSYVDLYLIHTPYGLKAIDCGTDFTLDSIQADANGKAYLDNGTDHIALWKEMEGLVEAGLTKSIGVSNFSVKQMKRLSAHARIPIAVNQVELHAYYQQRALVDYCKENDIVVTAYSPLGNPGRKDPSFLPPTYTSGVLPDLLNDPVVRLIATNHQVTAAQILIKFLVQSEIVVIPKSIHSERIRQNLDVFGFDLTPTEVEALRSLDKGEEGRSWNFSQIYVGLEEHPEWV